MNQPNCVELAKQGNPKAIAALMNQALQVKGITARATAKDGCLYLTLESNKEIKQETSVAWVLQGLKKLSISSINRVKIYGQKKGELSPSWSQQYEISEAQRSDENTISAQMSELQTVSQNATIAKDEKKTEQDNRNSASGKHAHNTLEKKIEKNLNRALSVIDEFGDRTKRNYKKGGLKQVYSGTSKKELAIIFGICLCSLYFFTQESKSPAPNATYRSPEVLPVTTAMPMPIPDQSSIELNSDRRSEILTRSSISSDVDKRIEFLRQLDGQLHLISQDNKYLGLLSSDVYERDSICNSSGKYGNQYDSNSIHNQFGSYGSEFSSDSPYSEHGQSPPVIVFQGQAIAVVTRNKYLASDLPKIDPSELLFAYQCYKN
jgi:flagellar motility protein MotE (MotC chaperone)